MLLWYECVKPCCFCILNLSSTVLCLSVACHYVEFALKVLYYTNQLLSHIVHLFCCSNLSFHHVCLSCNIMEYYIIVDVLRCLLTLLPWYRIA